MAPPPPFEMLGHTADLRLRATGKSPQELFANALRGMTEVIKPGAAVSGVSRKFSVSSVDLSALLVDFLNEALCLGNIHKEVYTDVKFSAFGDTHCGGELKGAPVRELDEDIKAVTHHDLKVSRTSDGYFETILVFDI